VDHGVRGGADGHTPFVLGPPQVPDRLGRVPPLGQAPGLGGEPPVPQLGERAGEVRVHVTAALHRQPAGLPRDDGRPPLRDRPAGERRHGVGHLPHQGPGQAEVPRAEGGGLPAGQGDLTRHPAAAVLRGHAAGGLRIAAGLVERRGLAGLGGGAHRLQLFQRPDPVDVLPLGHRGGQPGQHGRERGDPRGGENRRRSSHQRRCPAFEHASRLWHGTDTIPRPPTPCGRNKATPDSRRERCGEPVYARRGGHHSARARPRPSPTAIEGDPFT